MSSAASDASPLLPGKLPDASQPRIAPPCQRPTFLRSLWYIAVICWDWRTTLMMLFEIILCVTFAWAYRCVSLATGDWTYGMTGDVRSIWLDALKSMVFSVVVGAVVNGTIIFLGDIIMRVVWNAKLTKYTLERYMRPLAYYRVVAQVSDPDQRIATDIPTVCLKLRTVLFGTPLLIGMPPGLISVVTSAVWFCISIADLESWFSVLATLAFFSCFLLLNRFLVPFAAMAMKAELRSYSAYRFAHSHLRLHSEHVGFLKGEYLEESKLKSLMNRVINKSRAVAARSTTINVAASFFFIYCNTLGFVIPALSWRYLDIADLEINTYFALSNLITNLCLALVTALVLGTEFAELEAATIRVGELLMALDVVESALTAERKSTSVVSHDDSVVEYKNVSFASPGNKLVLRDINLSVPRGGRSNLLIMGPSGVGKSSILRVLGGLWPVLDGTITKPAAIGRGGITYMPQKPYLTLGTLKEQITYPDSPESITDDEAADLLRMVRMDYLLKRSGISVLSQTQMWCETLSGGEQQRLGIARILYQRPAFAVLDECTSALDEDIEYAVYEELWKRDISLISVAHRSTVKRWHQTLLQIERDGSYTVRSLPSQPPVVELDCRIGSPEPRMPSSTDFITPSDSSTTLIHEDVKLLVFCRALWHLFCVMLSSRPTAVISLVVAHLTFAVWFAWGYNYLSVNIASLTVAVIMNDLETFRTKAVELFVVSLLQACANALLIYAGDLLTMSVFNAVLTKWFLRSYLSPLVYYRVLGKVSDPDQRIAFDIQNFCLRLKTLLVGTTMYVGFITSAITSIWFTVSLYEHGGPFAVLMTYTLLIVLSLLNQLFTFPAARASKRETELRSSNRFSHTYFRVHGEHVAFLGGHQKEHLNFTSRLALLVDAATSVAKRSFPMNTTALSFRWLSLAFGYIIPGLDWRLVHWKDVYSLDTFTSVSVLILQLMYMLTTLIQLSQEFSDMMTVTVRLSEMAHALDAAQAELKREGDRQPATVIYDDSVVEYKNVSFASPGNKLVLRDINLSVPRGGRSNLLIMGPSGVGKSSILRVLGGLWPVLGGTITKPAAIGRGGITYMPQKPYLTLGTLKEQITYPDSPESITDDEAADLLRLVRMDYLLKRSSKSTKFLARRRGSDDSIFDEDELHEEMLLSPTAAEKSEVTLYSMNDDVSFLHSTENWTSTLSGGEQQRLGIARILYQRPAFAVLDECTSALDEDIEYAVYEELWKRDISLISVAHRSTVKRWHQKLLQIERDGLFRVTNIERTE